MAAYGINPQASLMFPFDKEVSEVLTVCHMGGMRSYGLSFDANYGFATVREAGHTLKIGTAPQWKSGVLIVR